MWNGKTKAVTFSYDDGVMQDKRLVEIFNKYGLRATFNLNSGMMYNECVWSPMPDVEVARLNHEECKEIFENMEVAAHSLTHPDLKSESDIMLERQIAGDKANLEYLFGRKIYGLVYPGGGGTNDKIIETARRFGIKYARLPYDMYEDISFSVPKDLYMITGVRNINKNLNKIVDDFLNLEREEPAMLYIWGHSYEFDMYSSWDEFESVCRRLSGKDDIFYGTNHEVLSPFYE